MERTRSSRLFVTGYLEPKKDAIVEKYEKGYSHWQKITSGLTELETIEVLSKSFARETAEGDVIASGMVASILTEPNKAKKVYHDLKMLNKDEFRTLLRDLCELVNERFQKFNDVTRSQIVWLCREMVRNMMKCDGLCWVLLRQAASGDTSSKNIHFTEGMLDIFLENRNWLEMFPPLLMSVVYSYLRLIEDHAAFPKLRQKEVHFVVALLREKFKECLCIGRDLARLLQNVARIPEIEALWRDIIYRPTILSPEFTGILQLFQTRTPPKLLQCRITPEVEKKINYFAFQVQFGHQKRYQDWFCLQHLSTPESQTLRPDLIRFIVGAIHPPNELLCSNILPRWAIIGWLITTCTSSMDAANSKLALFYDWLFFDPIRDNIMCIEPAILVITNSLKPHCNLTSDLLDFLCRIIPNFYPPIADSVKNCVYNALYEILNKKVLISLSPLFNNPRLDPILKGSLRNIFGQFMDDAPPIGGLMDEDDDADDMTDPNGDNSNDPGFSDDEVESKPTDKGGKKKSALILPDSINGLKKDLKAAFERLYSEETDQSKWEAVDSLMKLLSKESPEDAQVEKMADALSESFKLEFGKMFFSHPLTPEFLETSLKNPIFALCRNASRISDNSSGKSTILKTLAELRIRQSKFGYFYLYYFKACESSKGATKTELNNRKSIYKQFCEILGKEFEDVLMDDLEACSEDDVNLLCWLVPVVYKEFRKIAVNSERLLHIIVSCIDARQLQELVCKVLHGQLVMFEKSSFSAVICDTFSWETFEQYCVWQLVMAHELPLETVAGVLPKCNFSYNAEAITSVLLMLSRENPSEELMKIILCRELKPVSDLFVVTILHNWCGKDSKLLGKIIGDLLTSRCPAASPTKRKRGQGQGLGAKTGVSPPSAERILGHLERVREGCKELFEEGTMQKALQIAQAACTDTQRDLYKSLFALLEEEEVSVVTKSSTSKSRGRKTNNSSSSKEISYTSKQRNTSSRASMKELSDLSESSSELFPPLPAFPPPLLPRPPPPWQSPAYFIDLTVTDGGTTSYAVQEEVVKPKNVKKRRKVQFDGD